MKKQKDRRPFSFLRFLLSGFTLLLLLIGISIGIGAILKKPAQTGFNTRVRETYDPQDLAKLDQLIKDEWKRANVSPAPDADHYTLAKRLSLSLTGSVPALAEIRRLNITPKEKQHDAYLNYLLQDDRYTNYLAERLARVYVGVEEGPVLVYRRRRMVNWIADQLDANRPYDDMARELISSKGIWTTSPAANYITATVQPNAGKGAPDEIKLAARTSRAFLGVSLDCVQCHNDKFGDHWKQKDFHQFAAFFAQSDVGLSGVQDNPELTYETRFRGQAEAEPVSMLVPYQPEMLPTSGTPRDQLASWITHRNNKPFSRAIANRAWATLFGRPLVTPIDDIPIEGSNNPILEYLADYFVDSEYNLHSLYTLIASSTAFQRSSQSNDPETPITEAQEKAWASFPLTLLRPEQVSGSIIQASSVRPLNTSSHIIRRTIRAIETRDFINRYGDKGESEFVESTGTIPQRLLLMNGGLLDERTKPNPLLNSSSRIAILTKNDDIAIESAFLSVLTRKPNENERQHFLKQIKGKKDQDRQKAFQDIYWALMNTTEFSWNR